MPAPFIYWFLLPGCFFRSVVAVIRTCSDVYIHVLLLKCDVIVKHFVILYL